MPGEPPQLGFRRHLRTALNALYDPAVLRASPLIDLLGCRQHNNPVLALQRVLEAAIERLRLDPAAAGVTPSWRVYQILHRRYVGQAPQPRVAADLGLSLRQLQREESAALDMLADELWAHHRLADMLPTALTAAGLELTAARPNPAALTPTQELAHLADAALPQQVDLAELLRGVLATAAPLLAAQGATLVEALPASAPPRFLPAPVVRQALLNLVSVASRSAPQGRVIVGLTIGPTEVRVAITSAGGDAAPAMPRAELAETLQITRQMLTLCHAVLEVDTGRAGAGAAGPAVFGAAAIFPLAQPATILVIDDNQDALQLFQRYLSGTRYQFVGVTDPLRGLTLAAELQPGVIVVDVMMPERDGWILLAQLREHPRTTGIPVLVCSILPQEQLALSLGAGGFMRKPVSRRDFLAALDRLGPDAPGPASASR